jgi:hypothetical protein
VFIAQLDLPLYTECQFHVDKFRCDETPSIVTKSRNSQSIAMPTKAQMVVSNGTNSVSNDGVSLGLLVRMVKSMSDT